MDECDEEAVALKKEESQLLIGRREAGASDTIPTERSDAGRQLYSHESIGPGMGDHACLK